MVSQLYRILRTKERGMNTIDDWRTRARPSETGSRSELVKLYLAEVLSGAGDGIFWVALVVTLSDEQRFGFWLMLAVLARLGPRATLSIASGTLIDRSALRPLLVSIDSIRGALMIGLGLMNTIGVSPTPLLLCVLASYVIGVPTRPALTLAMLRISRETRLASANATISTLRQVMTFVGPLLGVAVVAASSPSIAFIVNAMSFAGSAVLVLSIGGLRITNPLSARLRPPVDPSRPSQRRLVGAFISGFEALGRAPELIGLVSLVGAMYFVRGTELVIHVLVVRDLLDADPGAIGYLAGAVGLGAVVAMPIASRSANSDHPVRPLLASVLLTTAPMASLALIGDLAEASALLVLVGVGMVVFEVVSVITIQRTVAASDLGRIFGALNSASNTGKLAGAIAAPALVAMFTTAGALVAIALFLALACALTVGSLRRIGHVAATRRRALDPIIDVLVSLALFDGAPRPALEQLAAAVEVCDVAINTVLICEGDQPDDLFVARTGQFDITVRGSTINTVGPDAWFGEIGLVQRVPRTATVRAITDATVWRIPGQTFIDALEESGAAPSALVQGIADRLAMIRSGQPSA